MVVVNVHERVLDASVTEIGKLIDTLASAEDKLWPRDRWPAIKFDRPLSVGAVVRPLHDALIEDALDRAQVYSGGQLAKREWSPWVKFLRHVMSPSQPANKKGQDRTEIT